ncbi:MAG: carboxymuconolactone decarboxylase [Rhizobiales bacterium 12-66-7]|jgi:AhpD family alkylhydroperoxidase|nr:MAG: carboxymuconolactone decarboxylase [Rhizobiales bacterium 12-66-7]OYX73118.1 MAG: carboxymuconolactone decarboxylase [Rhizobiales bacterium 32-66-11]
MPRVTPLPPTALPPEIAQVYEQFAGGYADFADQAAVLAHVPPALDHIYRMLMELRTREGVPWRYIELAVVVVSKLNACPYCVSHHAPLLAVEGIPADAIEGLPDSEHEAFDEVDRLVIDYARLVTQRAWGIRSGVFTQLRAHFSEAQVVELTFRIALCGFFNRFNDALQIDDGVAEAALHLHPKEEPATSGEQP